MNTEAIATLLGQFGIGGIFLFLLLRSEKQIEKKDQESRDDKREVVQAYQKNTEVITELKTITNLIYEELCDGREKK